MAPAPPTPTPGQTDSALSYLNSPFFLSPSCDNVTTSSFWFQNQKARRTSCQLPSSPATCSSSRKSQGSGCPALTMAPLLNAHCQQPGPSRHHLSLEARHSFLMVPLSRAPTQPHEASTETIRSQSRILCAALWMLSPLPSASAFEFPSSPRSSLLYLAYVISLHYCSQGRPHSGIKCHALPYLRIFTAADP